jgi:AICAR transformylase/IMP cyclohydrolase PurH
MSNISYRVFGTWNPEKNRAAYQVYKMQDETKILEKGVDGKSWSYRNLDDAEAYCAQLNAKELVNDNV